MANQDNAAENAVATTTDAPTEDAPTTDTPTTDASTTDAASESDNSVDESVETAAPVAEDNNSTSEDSSEETPAAPEQVYAPQPELSAALSSNTQSDEPRKEVANGRPYEIIYIARVGDDEAVEAVTQRVRELVEGAEGAIDNVRTSEVRRLAYPIRKEMEGIYVVINGRFAKEVTTEVERFFKLSEVVLRHMILRDDA